MKKAVIIFIIAIILSILILHSIVTIEVDHIFKCNNPTCRVCMEIQLIQKITELFNITLINNYLIFAFLAILLKTIANLDNIKKYCLVDLKIRLNE